ncbi:hypothetical protein Dimus_018186 [Dionaea muscipula]
MTVIHLKKKDVVKSKARGVEVEFDHEKLATILGIPGNNGICEYVKDVWEESKYIKPLEITRSRNRGGIGSERSSMMLRMRIQALQKNKKRFQEELHTAHLKQQEQGTSGVDPSGPTGREAEFLKFQAEFERKRANRFHDDLEKAKTENARLLALLHQAQTKPHP